jgi:hypothetical protein
MDVREAANQAELLPMQGRPETERVILSTVLGAY